MSSPINNVLLDVEKIMKRVDRPVQIELEEYDDQTQSPV